MKRLKSEQNISAGSMADIAFLLLIFFLVATTFLQSEGLMMKLPPDAETNQVPLKDRNVFKLRINSSNQYLVEGKVRKNLDDLTAEVKTFVLNRGKDATMSESPGDAVISIKTNRGTNYGNFIEVLDKVKEAYYQIYGERVGISSEEYRALDTSKEDQMEMYLAGKEGIPMNISIAEPDKVN